MIRRPKVTWSPARVALGLRLALALALVPVAVVPAVAATTTGKVQGRVLSTDNGEPIGLANVVLFPADSTMRRVGAQTNADGTYLLEAPAGRYTLQVSALSYGKKRIEGVEIQAGKLVQLSAALAPARIQLKEVVVEAHVRRDTDASLLAVRKKAATVGDAVSAEQVRRTPDKDAGEVLRRVTGLSVVDGKYVFVRGLGERYSSTELDGVRIVSPEQNKRVVPMDLLPANLLDHVTVQKTYTADRPGEFGGGDVQVRTRDFPGARTWSLSVSQGAVEGLTFHDRRTYAGGGSDLLGYGVGTRSIPSVIGAVAGDRTLTWSERNPSLGFKKSTLAYLGRAFSDVWSATSTHAVPNGSYQLTYGNEFELFHRPLGIITAGSLSRSFSQRDEVQRLFKSQTDTAYDYRASRDVASAQLGGVMGLSYRLSPSHSLHLRGFYSNSADDEVRTYTGQDHNRIESVSGNFYNYRDTRLMYLQRDLLSASLDGQHEFREFLGLRLDWRFGRSRANRHQPDRREVRYEERWYYPGDVSHWVLAGLGMRQFGDLHDEGWGTTLNTSVPYRLGRLGAGRVTLGYDRQSKLRQNRYRRFAIHHNGNVDIEGSAEQVFDPSTFDSTLNTAYVEETTDSLDNYSAHQLIKATYVCVDVPLGPRARANVGVRNEHGYQDVQTTALYAPSAITTEGKLDNSDWLPSVNVTWGFTDAVNLRLAASRTLSRPDLTELSPTRGQEEYYGGYQTAGNEKLNRARIDNYDIRLEAFPGLSEVLAVGFFYKRLYDPIEQVLLASTGEGLLLRPDNQQGGTNRGLEMEARAGLGRVMSRLRRFSLNFNASFIRSKVQLKPMNQGSELGSMEHPLQGQADYMVNAVLNYTVADNNFDVSLLLGATGKRLFALGTHPLPDIYEQPVTTLDAALNWKLPYGPRVKLAGRNLLNQEVRELQGGRLVSSYRNRRAASVTLSWGS